MPFYGFSANEGRNERKTYFLNKARKNYPPMFYREIRPMPEGVTCKKNFEFVLDLGNHYVGKFSFSMDNVDDFISAPVRVTVRFAEDLRELNGDFSAYKGNLCASWLQEEVLNIEFPGDVTMERRYSCRYIKFTVKDARRLVKFDNFCFTASTSADERNCIPAKIDDPMLKRIDDVAVYTLKECMQTCFEDGPKRDRRMWIGDLRLQALANYCTFNNRMLVRRCLYLMAATDVNDLGFMSAYIHDKPYFFSGRDHIADYAMFYVCTLCDYFEHTGDRETAQDLLAVCKGQMQAFANVLDEKGIVVNQPGWFAFIDWNKGLQKLTALQGVYLYTLEKFAAMLKALGDEEAAAYAQQLTKIRQASYNHLFDEKTGLFINETDGYNKSVHSQVFMILGGVIGDEQGRKALMTMLRDPEACQPNTPYMQHYVVEAMLKLGMVQEAKKYMTAFWGGMVEAGADTFWEAYVPGDPDFSPYGDHLVDSLCHAWSCTPTYLIRKIFI